MVLSVKILGNLSITLPVCQVLDSQNSRFLLKGDANFVHLIQPGQDVSLITRTENGISHLRAGSIQTISDSKQGIIVNI
jgi:hypothetical protein